MAKHKHNIDGPRLFKETLVPAEPGSGDFFKTEYEGNRDGAMAGVAEQMCGDRTAVRITNEVSLMPYGMD